MFSSYKYKTSIVEIPKCKVDLLQSLYIFFILVIVWISCVRIQMMVLTKNATSEAQASNLEQASSNTLAPPPAPAGYSTSSQTS